MLRSLVPFFEEEGIEKEREKRERKRETRVLPCANDLLCFIFLLCFFSTTTLKKPMVVADNPGASSGSGLTRLGAVDFSAMFNVRQKKRKRDLSRRRCREKKTATNEKAIDGRSSPWPSIFFPTHLFFSPPLFSNTSQVEASRLIGGIEASCVAIHPSRPVIAVVSCFWRRRGRFFFSIVALARSLAPSLSLTPPTNPVGEKKK